MPVWRPNYKVGPDVLVKSPHTGHMFRSVTKQTAKVASHYQVSLYNDNALPGMRKAGRTAANALRHLSCCGVIKPGANTKDIDAECERFIRDSGLIPSSIGYSGFPASVCTSVNNVACHGVPSENTVLKEGDLISMDVTCRDPESGFHGDTCYTMYVCSEDDQRKLDDLIRKRANKSTEMARQASQAMSTADSEPSLTDMVADMAGESGTSSSSISESSESSSSSEVCSKKEKLRDPPAIPVAIARFLLISQMTRDIGIFPLMQFLERERQNSAKLRLGMGGDETEIAPMLNEVGITIENHVSNHSLLWKEPSESNWIHTGCTPGRDSPLKRAIWVLTQYTGHGLGLGIHESPTVYHCALGAAHRSHRVPVLRGMSLTVEPIVICSMTHNEDNTHCYTDSSDDWSVVVPHTISAQFEHAMMVRESGQLEVFTVPDEPYPDPWVEVLMNYDREWLDENYPHISDFHTRGIPLDFMIRQTVGI